MITTPHAHEYFEFKFIFTYEFFSFIRFHHCCCVSVSVFSMLVMYLPLFTVRCAMCVCAPVETNEEAVENDDGENDNSSNTEPRNITRKEKIK